MITVVIPSHPGREAVLVRALASAWNQSFSPAKILVEVDTRQEGPAVTRNRALSTVTTEWVAFLDSDDELKPQHLRACLRHATLTGADVVYPGYDADGDDPVGCFGIPFSPDLLRWRNYVPVTTLCRTEAVKAAGGFRDHPDADGKPCEDWGLWLSLLEHGARFSHLPQRTWIWHVNGGVHGSR